MGPACWGKDIREDQNSSPYCDFGNSRRRFIFREYQTVVQEYNSKELKYSGDVFNAFEGIYNRFNSPDKRQNLRAGQAQGIPFRFLPDVLLWFPGEGAQR